MKCGSVNIHIEVPTFLLFFAYTIATSVTTNLIIFKTCYVTLNFNESQCASLGTNYSDKATAELEKQVQSYATLVMIGLLVIEAVIPPVLCIFLGPWSDKYGRKPLLLSCIGGCILSFVVITVISALHGASPWFFLLFLVPMCLSGGVPALLTAMLSYITDVTSEENRGIRIGVFEGVIAVATIVGTSSSSFILEACGYIVLYCICTGCVTAAWLYAVFLIPESVQEVETEGRFQNLFNFSLVKDAVRATVGRRENHNRSLMLTIILVMVASVFASFGDTAVLFLYLRQRFQWTLQKFTIYSSISNLTGIAGAVIGIYFLHKLCRFREATVILLGFLSIFVGSLLQTFSTADWLIYTATASKCLSSATSPMSRSLLSKLAPTTSSGKVFAVATSIETLSALVGSVIYTYIYNATLTSFPAVFNYVSCVIYFCEIVAVILIIKLQRGQSDVTYIAID